MTAVARIFRTETRIIREIEKDFAKPYYTTDEITASVLLWAKKHDRWPRGDDWGDFEFSQTTFSRRFRTRQTDGLTGFQEFLLRSNSDTWIQRNLTAKLVLDIGNLTVRRLAFDRYGTENVIRQGGGHKIQHDEYGTLWQLPTDNTRDNRVLYVEVVNKTKNPKGRYDHYFLRVPATCQTARQAVAWTFSRGTGTPAVPLFTAES